MTEKLLAGHLAVVTGAAQGNGKAIAFGLAQAGARVVLADINEGEVLQTKAELEASGANVWAFQWDVTDPARARAVAEQVGDVAGDVSILVNNAGVLLRSLLGSPGDAEAWHRTLAVNVDGPFFAVTAFLDQLKRRRGCIINVASIQSYVASIRNAVGYTASKGAIMQLTKALAFELAPFGVRVNAVAPGFIETPMNQASRDDPERMAQVIGHIPMQRIGQPHDLAGPTVFLASELAAYVTGIVLPVDGGFLIV